MFQLSEWKWILPYLKELAALQRDFIPHIGYTVAKSMHTIEDPSSEPQNRVKEFLELDHALLKELIPDEIQQKTFLLTLVEDGQFPKLDAKTLELFTGLQGRIKAFLE